MFEELQTIVSEMELFWDMKCYTKRNGMIHTEMNI